MEDAGGLTPGKDDKHNYAENTPFQTGSYKCVMLKHKLFGSGEIYRIDNKQKYIYVTFKVNDKDVEKTFVFPNAFVDGFLKLIE